MVILISAMRNAGLAFILRWLGAVLSRRQVHGAAAWCYREALALVPKQGVALQFALAKSHWQMGEKDIARRLLQSILELNPSHPEALNLFGAMALSEGQDEVAEAQFVEAIRLSPQWAAPCNNLGNVFLGRDDFDAAEAWYRRALANDADYAEALCNLGLVLNRTGRYQSAEALCRKALQVNPGFAGAANNLGSVLINLGRIAEGIRYYQHALQLDPSLAEAHINLALFLGEPAHLVGAIEHFQRQLEINPRSYIALLRLAQAHLARNEYDLAEDYARRAVAVKPEAPDVYSILGELLKLVGCQEEADSCFIRALEYGAGIGTHTSFIFHLHYGADSSPDEIALEARTWAIKHAETLAQRRRRVQHEVPNKEKHRLKIGYISKDFYRHPVVNFLEPLLAHHNKQRVKIYCYANLLKPDDVTERLKKYADVWRNVSMLSDDELVSLIRNDAIDILVDLSGHTTGARLLALAYKPAPIQVTYLGYPGTTGLKAIDYRIVDAITDPPASVSRYATETLVRLPGCFLSFQPSLEAPPVTPSPHLQTGSITFGCFNNIAKVNRAVIAAWADILKRVPNSHLLLKAFSFSSERVKQRYYAYFAAHGIAQSRLDFYAWVTEAPKHLDLYGQVDIALDPFPYNGTTTTCEALWMGVPVICLEGKSHAASVGASLLNSLGLEELLASDINDYVSKAVALANAPERLSALRSGMRERMQNSPLLDHARFASTLEDAYEAMWRDYAERKLTVPAEIELPLAKVARILLPDSLEVITRYVVEEQGDWFEAEMHFVRQFLTPGMRMIDVGANYGVYALTAAAQVGPNGAVWAFEPSATVAGLLQRSAAINGFDHLTVLEHAVSHYQGTALFAEASNSELSCLLESAASEALIEQAVSVSVTTLDDCQRDLAWGEIDFIKIDAEGQEPLVVRGAQRLLTSDAPLVMAEFKHGLEFNTGMEAEFRAIGFEPYRLVRGPMVLMPFRAEEPIDPYLLNLFFCHPEKAALLAKRGMLVVGDLGENTEPELTYAQILHLHRCSLHQDKTGGERLAALKQALAGMEALIANSSPSLPIQLSWARLLFDYGHQERARAEYAQILKALRRDIVSLEGESFLPPAGPFENIAGAENLQQWLIAAVAEWLASYSAYSSYFSPADALHYLRIVRRTGYLPEEINRRIELLLRR